MRIAVLGDSECAAALRGLLAHAGYVVSDHFAQYTIRIVEGPVAHPTVDGIDCELERQIVKHITKLSPSGRVTLQRGGGVRSDRAVEITVPANPDERHAVEVGTMRGVMAVRQQRRPWWQVWSVVLLVSLWAASASAQVQLPSTAGSGGGGGTGGTVDQGTGGASAWLIKLSQTTSNNDVDVLSLPALAAGANNIGHVTFDNTTLAVTNTGTFATQATLAAETTKVIGTVNIAAAQSLAITGSVAVTGTFWQVTQPISAAALPLPTLASTSTKQSDGTQKTQIVDGSGNVIGATSNALDINIKSGNPTTITATQGTGTNLHTVVDSGNITVSDGAGALNVIVDSATLGTVTVSDGAGALNTIVDSGTLTAVTTITNPVTVTDGAGALNVIVDSGAITATVTDGAGALNTIIDSGTVTAVTTITNPVTVTDGAGSLNVIVDSGTLNVGTVTTLPALVAGTALIGKVGIDQTTPGTTNRVDVGVFPDNEPFNVAQYGGTNVGATNAVHVRNGAPAQTTGTLTSTTCPGTGCVTATSLADMGSVSFMLSGTYSATIVFQVSIDSSVFAAQECQLSGSETITSTTGAAVNTTFVFHCQLPAGTTDFRLAATAYTSGTVNVRIAPAAESYAMLQPNSTTTPGQVNVTQINGVAPLMGIGASGTGAQRTASLIHDGTDKMEVTTDGSAQVEPPRVNIVNIGGQESVAAPTAATWYIRKQWALPASAHFTPGTSWATVTTALTKTLIGIGNSLGTLNVGTNTFAAVNSVASPFFYSRLFGCVTTVLSATPDTVTPTYNNELGTSHAATGVAFAASTPVGNCFEFPLAAGLVASSQDVGVRSVTAAVDTAATTGVITFYGVNPIADFLGTANGQTEIIDSARFGELNANEQIFVFMMQAATTAQLKTFGLSGTLR